MKKLPFSFLALTIHLYAVSNADISIGPTFSGGEISKQYSYDMDGTTGSYAYGANLSIEKKYIESNFQFEMGWYNLNPSYGIGLDINGKYGIFQDIVKLYAGIGFAYNGFAYDYWKGRSSIVGEFTHEYSPYLSAKVEIFQRLRIGFEGLFNSKYFWKARIGLVIFHFQ